jgi:hypothetical protein
VDSYNYSVFDMAATDPWFADFSNRLHVGERAPSFAVEELASGESVAMKSLWKDGPVIIEFGSFT